MTTPIKAPSATTIRFNDAYTKNLAQTAAEIQGQSLSGFIMTAIRSYGETVIKERMQAIQEFGPIVLSANDYTALMKALNSPQKPVKALGKAMAEYRKLKIPRKDY